MKRTTLGAARPIWLPANVLIIGHGNSRMAGVGTSSNATRSIDQATTLFPLRGNGFIPTNLGIGGQRIFTPNGGYQDMMTTGKSSVDPLFTQAKLVVLLAWEGTNEINAIGGNGALSAAEWRTYCLTRKANAVAQGIKLRIVAGTCNPFMGGTTDSLCDANNQQVLIYNNILRMGWREYADVLCDFAAWGEYGAINAAAKANGSYTQAMFQTGPNSAVFQRSDGVANDYTHSGDYGYGVDAACLADALTRVAA